MAQLLVRNIEEAVVKRLRKKAARDGVSMEEEHRRILRHALSSPSKGKTKSFKECLVALSGALQEYDSSWRRDMPRKIDL